MIDLQTSVLLSAALPSITSEITLERNGHRISGNNAFRVLHVQATGNLIINNTIITNGYIYGGGGGIHNNGGTLTVNNSTLSGNFANYGGGGSISGTVTVNNSTFSNNFSVYGGGAISGTTVTINNSTFNGNSTIFGSGGDARSVGFMPGPSDINPTWHAGYRSRYHPG